MIHEQEHERARELAALRLYGELDEHELRHLEGHLEACPSCAAHTHELARVLGPWKERHEQAAPPEELPAGWAERLRAAPAAAPPAPPRRRALLAFAAGLAAGALATWALSARRPDDPAGPLSPAPSGAGGGSARTEVVVLTNAGARPRLPAPGDRPPTATHAGGESLFAGLAGR